MQVGNRGLIYDNNIKLYAVTPNFFNGCFQECTRAVSQSCVKGRCLVRVPDGVQCSACSKYNSVEVAVGSVLLHVLGVACIQQCAGDVFERVFSRCWLISLSLVAVQSCTYCMGHGILQSNGIIIHSRFHAINSSRRCPECFLRCVCM